MQHKQACLLVDCLVDDAKGAFTENSTLRVARHADQLLSLCSCHMVAKLRAPWALPGGLLTRAPQAMESCMREGHSRHHGWAIWLQAADAQGGGKAYAVPPFRWTRHAGFYDGWVVAMPRR